MKIKNFANYLGECIFAIGIGIFAFNFLKPESIAVESGVKFYSYWGAFLISIGLMLMALGLFSYINKIISKWRPQ